MDREKGIVVISGGMDSTVLAYLMRSQDIRLISFDYGQRHKKELKYARLTADTLGVPHTVVPMSFMNTLLHGSALTSPDVEVPEGHYAEESMKQTVVPNRNSIMLNIAAGIAVAEECKWVATGVHAGDHAVYPDCRPEFIRSLTKTLLVANEGFIDPKFQILAPFVGLGKHDIARLGADLNVPFWYTWSCYVGGDKHCGRCGTCVERKEAFRLAEVPDSTEYEDPTYGVEAYRGLHLQ